ncbi:MAG: PepSY domain-containing protein [Acutalibacteraceae bacterium]
MKKAIRKSFAIILSILTVLSLSVCSFAALSLEEAKAIALGDAGFSEAQVQIKECKQDGAEFDVEFFKDGAEYDYTISAKGTITSFSFDTNRRITGSKALDAAAAKQKALDFTGINEADAKALMAEYDKEDVEYEISFINGSKEYSVTVSAVDGTVIEYEYELLAGGNSFFASFIAFIESIIAMFRNLFVK